MKARVRMLYPTFIGPVLRKAGVLKIKNCINSLANQNIEIKPQMYFPAMLPSVKSSVLKIEKRAKLDTVRKIKNP